VSEITLILTARALRRHTTVKFVWLYLAKSLPLDQPQTIKVGRTARQIGLKPQRVRDALRLLVDHGYLVCIAPPTGGSPGTYQFGPRAYLTARTGAAVAPVADGAPLPDRDRAA
jgi:DNA-binding IclR family transcriptional regulator